MSVTAAFSVRNLKIEATYRMAEYVNILTFSGYLVKEKMEYFSGFVVNISKVTMHNISVLFV